MIFLATQKDVMIRHFQWILDLKRDTEWQKKESPFNLTDDSPLVAGIRISWRSILSVRNGRKGGGLNNEKLRPLRDLSINIPIRFWK